MIRYIRQSEIKKFKRCRRSWMNAYVRNLEPKTEKVGAATVGTIVHAGLEAYYRSEGWDTPMMEAAGDVSEPARRNALELANIMVEGYVDWVAETGADVGLEVVAVEQRIEVPFGEILGDRIIVTGQLDLRVKDAAGRNLFLDHKTVQSISADRQLQVDDQLLTYAVLLRMSEDFFIDGATHNQLRKVKRTARANPPFYGRQEMHFNPTQIRNHYLHLHATIESLVATAQALEAGGDHHRLAYPNPTKDCSWDCAFFPVCPMHDDGSDLEGVLAEFYRERQPA